MIKTRHILSLVLLTCSSAFAMQQESTPTLPDTETLLRDNRPEYKYLQQCLISASVPAVTADEKIRQREHACGVCENIMHRVSLGKSFEQVGGHWPPLFRDILLGNLPTPDVKETERQPHDSRGIKHIPPYLRGALLGQWPICDVEVTVLRLPHADLRGIDYLPLVCGYENLKQLKFIHNGISEIPSGINALTSLTNLNLSCNKITVLPPEMAELQNLKKLKLINNGISEIPPGINALTSLEVLYLSWNRITTLPPEMAELPNLRTLVLHRNRIKAVSRAILPSNLKVLILSRNKIAALSGNDVPSTLQELHLAHNHMKIPPVDMDYLPALVGLKLDHNAIKTITLTNLPTCENCYVFLADNNIAELPSAIVVRTGLRLLDLKQNPIAYDNEALKQVAAWLPMCIVAPLVREQRTFLKKPDSSEDY